MCIRDRFTNISEEIFSPNDEIKEIQTSNSSLEILSKPVIDTVEVLDDEIIEIPDPKPDLGFDYGLLIGIIIGSAIGISFILIIRQKNT